MFNPQGQILGRVVAEPPVLQTRPQLLDRIQHRGVRRQPFQSKSPPMASEEIADRIALVHVAAVPDDRDRTRRLRHNAVEEGGHGDAIEVVVGQRAVRQPLGPTVAIQPQGGRQRDFFPVSSALFENRRLAARRPRPPRHRRHQQATFVDENDVAAIPPRFLEPGPFRSAPPADDLGIAFSGNALGLLGGVTLPVKSVAGIAGIERHPPGLPDERSEPFGGP